MWWSAGGMTRSNKRTLVIAYGLGYDVGFRVQNLRLQGLKLSFGIVLQAEFSA